METKVADRIVDVLRERKIDTVFGVPGGLISTIYAALTKSDIRVITAKHESSAVLLAIGYSMATQRPGVVLVTAGPGVTNATTGVATAMSERIPLLILAGEVPRSAFGRGALQEGSSHAFDAVGMLESITKLSLTLTRPDAAVATIQRAFATACSGVPGPVFISIPVDVSGALAPPSEIAGRVSLRLEADRDACARAMETLVAARRPLIVAGSGARGATNKRALVELAERAGTPVTVTPKGKSVFPEDHPLYLGVLGFGGHESVLTYLKDGPDVVLICGAGMNDFSTNAWTPLLVPSHKLIHIDLDANKFGRNYHADLCLLGPMEEVIALMMAGCDRRGTPKELPAIARQPYEIIPGRPLHTATVIEALNELVPKHSIFVADMGEHLAFALHHLRVRKEGDFVTCLGFGAMGTSIPVGIGLGLGAKAIGRRTYVICGDGGMLLSGLEIATAAQWRAAVTFVVMNDARLNMCHHGMLAHHGIVNDFSTQVVDFAAIAQACGATGRIVKTRAELTAALRTPAADVELLDVHVDPEVHLGGSQRIAALRQFTETPR